MTLSSRRLRGSALLVAGALVLACAQAGPMAQAADPLLTVTKQALETGDLLQPGDERNYTFTVTNGTADTITDLEISGDQALGLGSFVGSCLPTTLLTGGSASCTGSYEPNLDGYHAGSHSYQVTVSGTHLTSGTAVESLPTTVNVSIVKVSELLLHKEPSPRVVDVAGDIVTVVFELTNSGNQTLTNLWVQDLLHGSFLCLASLEPGKSDECQTTYVVTQADINRGVITNTAQVYGYDPSGAQIWSNTEESFVVVRGQGAMQLTKEGALAPGTEMPVKVGDIINYTFFILNVSWGRANLVQVLDPHLDAPAPCYLNKNGALIVGNTGMGTGDRATCYGQHTITQADLNRGYIENTAVITALHPNGVLRGVASEPATHYIPLSPDLRIEKKGLYPRLDPTAVSELNDLLTYTFEVTNRGRGTATNIAVVDFLESRIYTDIMVTCPFTTLAKDESMICTAEYRLEQADLNRGWVWNTAYATGKDSEGNDVVSPQDSEFIYLVTDLKLDFTKDGMLISPTDSKPGDMASYSFTITNTGTGTVTEITIADPKITSVTCPEDYLEPTESMSCWAYYSITQADINAGKVYNQARAVGKSWDGSEDVVSAYDDVTLNLTQTPGLSLVKYGSVAVVDGAVLSPVVGHLVNYSFQVENTGNLTLTNLVIADPKVSGVTCPTTTLEPGETTTCTGTYAITQADLNAGQISNTATATARDPNNGPISDTDTALLSLTQIANLSLEKTADRSTLVNGQTITYRYRVVNGGNVAITNLTILDTFSGAWPLSEIDCPVTILTPGASTTCLATYTVTQSDYDVGVLNNTAQARGTPPIGTNTYSNEDSVSLVRDPVTASVFLAKTGTLAPSASSPPRAGDLVNYTFTVTNTGPLTLTDFVFTDSKIPSGITCWTILPTGLAPGGEANCVGSYTLTQADINAGSVVNVAHVTAQDPQNVAVQSAQATATVDLYRSPSLSVTKSGSVEDVGDRAQAPGDLIEYSIRVENTGNVSLTQLAVTDPLIADLTCGTTTLEPNASMTCTGTYAITQADLDAGKVDNTAGVSGRAPGGALVTGEDSTTVGLTQALVPMSLVKTANRDSLVLGQVVTYTFAVKNNANVTLHDLIIMEDTFSGSGTISAITCLATTLAPGASTTCSATYTVSQADVDSLQVINRATARAYRSHSAGYFTVYSNQDLVQIPGTGEADMAFLKYGVLDVATAHTPIIAGDRIFYTFTVTNTGPLTLTNITITDNRVATITCDSAVLQAQLLPGEEVICRATYIITQTDLDQMEAVVNTASVVATALGSGDTVGPLTDSASVNLTRAALMTVTKYGALAPVTPSGRAPRVGDDVAYTVIVLNTGNLTLTGLAVNDPLVGLTCSTTTLAPATTTNPAQEAVCTGTYKLTQADIDAGEVKNTATATAIRPSGLTLGPLSDTVTINLPQVRTMTMTKTANPTAVTAAGQMVTYSFEITNTGNTTIYRVAITEVSFSGTGMLSTIMCPQIAVPPNGKITCSATYYVTQADINAGEINNSARADVVWDDPTRTPSSSQPRTAVVTASRNTEVTMAKTGVIDSGGRLVPKAGDQVNYSFLISNKGNTTLTDIS
ncbi:MAG: DUF11 domain-containing protein, partial [Propionibacteriaceae bacterium]|nr:DUF11 domain-containing protein [Propionibacteriaceae bacterium]